MTTPTPHGATVHIIEPPDFDPRPGVTDSMSPDDLWQYACLVGYRYKLSEHDREQSARAAIQQAAGAVPKMPEPEAWRVRYRSEPGMIGHYPWTYTGRKPRYITDGNNEVEAVYTEAQVQSMLAASPAPPKQQPALGRGEVGRVTQPEFAGDELALFRHTLEGFADCGETETDYDTLVSWAQRGLLECTNFRPTAAAHRMLASSTSTAQKGGEK